MHVTSVPRALYGVPHTNILHGILILFVDTCFNGIRDYYHVVQVLRTTPGFSLHHVRILSTGEIDTAESAPHTTSYHCGSNMGMDKSRVSGMQSTSLAYQGQR